MKVLIKCLNEDLSSNIVSENCRSNKAFDQLKILALIYDKILKQNNNDICKIFYSNIQR